MGAATLVDNIDPTRLRELMVERDVDVAALAADAGVERPREVPTPACTLEGELDLPGMFSLIPRGTNPMVVML